MKPKGLIFMILLFKYTESIFVGLIITNGLVDL